MPRLRCETRAFDSTRIALLDPPLHPSTLARRATPTATFAPPRRFPDPPAPYLRPMPHRPAELVPGRRYGLSIEVDGALQHHGPVQFVGWEGAVAVFQGPTGEMRIVEGELMRVDLIR